jgi:hypothetical protein
MQGRPLSSRPSSSARPTTAFDRDQFQHQQRLEQQIEEEEYEEEESDDEDVFAFSPPTTANQEKHSHFTVPYPEPAFDPWGRQYPISPPPPIPPHPHPYIRPVSPSSPSTGSHPSTGMSGPDFYRLKRLGTAASSNLAVVEENGVNSDRYQQQQAASSLADSLSEDDESRSIKSVFFIFIVMCEFEEYCRRLLDISAMSFYFCICILGDMALLGFGQLLSLIYRSASFFSCMAWFR